MPNPIPKVKFPAGVVRSPSAFWFEMPRAPTSAVKGPSALSHPVAVRCHAISVAVVAAQLGDTTVMTRVAPWLSTSSMARRRGAVVGAGGGTVIGGGAVVSGAGGRVVGGAGDELGATVLVVVVLVVVVVVVVLVLVVEATVVALVVVIVAASILSDPLVDRPQPAMHRTPNTMAAVRALRRRGLVRGGTTAPYRLHGLGSSEFLSGGPGRRVR